MNKITEEAIDFNDIFHYLKGEYKMVDGHYYFLLKSGFGGIPDIHYVTNDIDLIADPALDVNFKSIFLNHSKRLENFLNSIYFNPHSLNISDIEFLQGEFNQIGIQYNLNTLRADIACKGKVCALVNGKETEESKDTLIDVEIQINWIENIDDRLLEYGSLLKNSYTAKIREEKYKEQKNKKEKEGGNIKKEKRVYLDTLVIALILDKNQSHLSNMTKLVKKTNGHQIALDKLNILEINVFNLTNPFLNETKICGKILLKDGIDWIKLISLRSWAKKKMGYFAKYAFPKLLKGHKYSSNQYIDDAIKELILGNIMIISLYTQVEMDLYEREEMGWKNGEIVGRKKGVEEGKILGEVEGRKKGVEEGIKIGEVEGRKKGVEEGIKIGEVEGRKKGVEEGIKIGKEESEKKIREAKLLTAFFIFIGGQEIEQFNLEYTYNKNEIKPILQKEYSGNLNDEIITKFIDALVKKNAISK